jgi:hypothetical protein
MDDADQVLPVSGPISTYAVELAAFQGARSSPATALVVADSKEYGIEIFDVDLTTKESTLVRPPFHSISFDCGSNFYFCR